MTYKYTLCRRWAFSLRKCALKTMVCGLLILPSMQSKSQVVYRSLDIYTTKFQVYTYSYFIDLLIVRLSCKWRILTSINSVRNANQVVTCICLTRCKPIRENVNMKTKSINGNEDSLPSLTPPGVLKAHSWPTS